MAPGRHLACAIKILSLCILVKECAAQQQCYYPAGNPSPDVPCNTTAGAVSACCNEAAFCLGNGLCYLDAVISRGSCTDKNFQDSACPSYCTEWLPNSGAVLVNCNASSDAFICAGQDCGDATALFTMRDANSFVFNNSENVLIELSPRSVVDFSSSASQNASTTNSSDSQTSTSPAMLSSSAASSSSASAKYTAGDMAGVGVGIGIPLLLALLGALFVIQKQKKRLDALSARAAVPPQQAAPDYSKQGLNAYPPQADYQQPLMNAHQGGYSVPPQYRQEMEGVPQINELSDEPERQELEAAK